MLLDGITLVPGSIALNTLIENGPSLPRTNLRSGRMFFLTRDADGLTSGVYAYSGLAWTPMGSVSGGSSGPSVVKYDIGLFCGGRVTDPNAVLAAYITPRDTYLQANLPGSVARCKTPPMANTVYFINIDDVANGTVVFAAGSTVGTITFDYDMMLSAGQMLELVGPNSPDAVISDVGITLVANVGVEAGVLS